MGLSDVLFTLEVESGQSEGKKDDLNCGLTLT